ncbi:MAG: aspartate aminotransferase [Thiotrichales bacterium]|nr:aspartate aminotransferase [Thiotrichales bacterium]
MALTASRWDDLEGSKIGEAYELALELKAQGRQIFDLTTGEPDFASPEHANAAGKAAIDNGQTKYTPTDGDMALKESVQLKYRRDNGLEFDINQICIGSGAKPLLYYVLLTILDIGDEVIVPTPAWTSFPGMVELAGAVPKLVSCTREQGYKLTPQALETTLGERTKAIIINTPSNPTGAVYSRTELEALEPILSAYPDVVIVADEIYEYLVYDVEFASVAATLPSLAHRIVSVNGASKGYAMTGWRIGYAAGPVLIMDTLRKLLSQSAGNPTTMSQLATIAAIEGPQDLLAERSELYRRRRDLAVQILNQAPGLHVDPPDGAFYLYVDCSEALGSQTPDGKVLEDDAAFCQYLLESEGVATVPSVGFYAPGGFRVSYACDEETLREACQRIARACNHLR